MNLDIETEHVAMRPEWHRVIEEWVRGCGARHPDVVGIDVTLRHGGQGTGEDQVDVRATACGRDVRAGGHAAMMGVALHEALDALEWELLVHEASDRARIVDRHERFFRTKRANSGGDS